MEDVKYCYRCGRRVSKELPDCWYCGTSVHRTIRPERRCPYCDEVVRTKAIKCASCGEFLEPPLEVEREDAGRGTVGQAAGQTRTPRGGAPEARTKPAAGNVGHESRRKLEHETRLKLEAPTRFRRGAQPDSTQSKDLVRIGGRERELTTVEVEIEPEPPARIDPAGRTLTVQEERGDEPRRGSWFDRLWGRRRATTEPGGPRVELRERSRYRICAICQTEIFVSDNYCFHCGQKYAPRAFRFDTRTYGPLNFGAYALAVALLIPNLLYYLVDNKPPGWVLVASALASAGVLASTALNSDDRRNRLVSWALLLAVLAVAGVPLFLTYAPG